MAEQVEVPTKVNLTKYIEVRIFGERPHIRGRRIPVATIAYSHRDPGWSVAELAYNFGLSEPEVLSALLYYEENRDMIDAQEAAYQVELDEAYRLYGTKD